MHGETMKKIPNNSSLFTVTLHSSFITTLVYNDTPFIATQNILLLL